MSLTQAEGALREAAISGDLATLTRLVKQGVNLEATYELERTALMETAVNGRLDCLEYLIAKGAKLNAQSNNKSTALYYAAYFGHAPCVESLLKAGADASLKDKYGKTALDFAKEKKHTEVVKLLENTPATAAQAAPAPPTRGMADLSVTSAPRTKDFDLFISHNTKDSSYTVFQALSSFMSAYDKVIFNPTTNLSHVEQINKAAMAGAVRRSNVVLAALSEGFFASTWCEAEIEAAREAGIKVIPCYSGEEYGAKQVDTWVEQYNNDSHPNFKYIFRENVRDVVNKQNPESVKRTLKYLATLC